MIVCLILVRVFRGALSLTNRPVLATAFLFAAGLSTGFYGVYITSVLQHD